MRKMPVDTLSSVDTALRLIHLLRDQGELGVTEAASMLEVSVSSAHRLLATLAFRDFAERTERRRYIAGPALKLRPESGLSVLALRQSMRPAMRRLSEELGETMSLGVLLEGRVRIIATVETKRALRVGDQEGTTLPAHKTAIGKAMLACLTEDQAFARIATSYGSLAGEERRAITADLAGVRRRGFALNHGDAEPGVTAIGVPVFDRDGRVRAGLAAVMPSSRFEHSDVDAFALELSAGVRELRDGLDFSAAGGDDG